MTPENFIARVRQTSDAAVAVPSPAAQAAALNNLNQLTDLTGQPYSCDVNGNLLSDGQRHSWDAENRLVAISYPSQAGAS